jgi:uncharacterized membrane protein YdcZ (DUF606 family)
MMAIVASEFPFVQPDLYAQQTPTVVYLSGVLLFVAGLAIVRAHNSWALDWTTLVTLSGWVGGALGLVRMFAASLYLRQYASTGPNVFMIVEVVLFCCGGVMTYQSFRRGRETVTKP